MVKPIDNDVVEIGVNFGLSMGGLIFFFFWSITLASLIFGKTRLDILLL